MENSKSVLSQELRIRSLAVIGRDIVKIQADNFANGKASNASGTDITDHRLSAAEFITKGYVGGVAAGINKSEFKRAAGRNRGNFESEYDSSFGGLTNDSVIIESEYDSSFGGLTNDSVITIQDLEEEEKTTHNPKRKCNNTQQGLGIGVGASIAAAAMILVSVGKSGMLVNHPRSILGVVLIIALVSTFIIIGAGLVGNMMDQKVNNELSKPKATVLDNNEQLQK